MCSGVPKVADLEEQAPAVTGRETTLMAAGLTAILYMMPRLLDMIFREKSPGAAVHKMVLKLLGPQIAEILLTGDKVQTILYMVAKALGPIKGTFMGATAQLVLKLVLAYIRGNEIPSLSALKRVGQEAALACFALVLPPALYARTLLSAAAKLLGSMYAVSRDRISGSIAAAVEYLSAVLPIAATAVGVGLLIFGTSTPTMVAAVGMLGAAASTGTPIAALGGAAATNAALAWLGGGAVAAGGGGMAAGAMVMAAAAACGAVIAVGGVAMIGYMAYKAMSGPDHLSEVLQTRHLI